VLLGAAAVASLPWPLGIGPSVPHGLFPPHWHGFLLGVASYWAWKEPGCRPFVAAWGGLLVLGAWRTGSDFTAVCAATALLLHAAARGGRLNALDRRWLQGIGTVSYSLYLCHNPITGAVFRLGFGLTGRTLATEILWLAVALVACLGGAAALWWLVERPSQILSRRIGKPGRPRIGAAPAAGAPRLSA
jgi:peptidoglycan/LPS O-acetylase OafA/YrhL